MKARRVVTAALVAMALALSSVGIHAQETASDETGVKLSKAEKDQIEAIAAGTQQETRLAQAELDIVKAQLNRLLISPEADMKEVERLLRQGLEWELKIRMAQIRRETQTRKIVGDRRWAGLVTDTRARQVERTRQAIMQKAEERIGKLAQQIAEWKVDKLTREEVQRRLANQLRQLLQTAIQDFGDTTASP